MAAAGGRGGGGRHWMAEEKSGLRADVLQNLTTKLAPFYQPYSQEAPRIAAKFEEEAFRGANSKGDYMRNISNKLISIEKIKTEELQRRMQSRTQVHRANAPQALQGGNSSVIPDVMMMASPRPTSQPMIPKISGLVPNQHIGYPCMPNTQIEIEQKHPGMMAITDRCLNLQPGTVIATVGPGVQPGPRLMQSGASQKQGQYLTRQPQAMNFVGYSPTSVSKPATRPNSQQNHLLGQNDSAIGSQQQPTRMNQQTSGANQHEMDLQNYQILGAHQANASKMQYARQTESLHSTLKACEPEPMTRTLQQIGGAQQSTLACQNSQIPATMASTREHDLMEKMFCQIKSWKDAYYLQFVELDQRFALPALLTEEQLSSLPGPKANAYRKRAGLKKLIRKVLDFLLLKKSDVHEGFKLEFRNYKKDIHNLLDFIEKTKASDAKVNTGHQLQNCGEQPQAINPAGNASPITGGKSRQQKQPADASILQSRQTTMARTPPVNQHNNGNHLLGIANPSSSISSPGTLQSWSTSMLECLTPSPVAKPVVAPDTPCAVVMSTFSKDVDNISAFLLHGNAEAAAPPPKANSSNQVTPTKPTASSSPLQAETGAGQAEDQARGRDGTPFTKKPIDRLIDAMRSSSPAALRSSANSIWSVLTISDIVPHGKIGTILDCKSSQQQQFGGSNTVNKMKRVFNNTASCSESLLSGNIDSSCMSFECDALDSGSSSEISIKRQKTQIANGALLEEIKSINSTLIDTVISMSTDSGTDGIASCDGGTTIKLSFSAVSLSPTVKSLFATSETSLVLPTKLFIPPDYPSRSPVLINHEGDEVLRKNSRAISTSVDVAFRHVLGDIPEPRSIKETARAWDACVRKAVMEFAHQHGGGTITSMLGQWERCVAA